MPGKFVTLKSDDRPKEGIHMSAEAEALSTNVDLKIVLESDQDVWTAYCPALVREGASTWGRTRDEALQNIKEAVSIVISSLEEHPNSADQKLVSSSVDQADVKLHRE